VAARGEDHFAAVVGAKYASGLPYSFANVTASTKSTLRSPTSDFQMNACPLPSRRAASTCVMPAALRAARSFFRNDWYLGS